MARSVGKGAANTLQAFASTVQIIGNLRGCLSAQGDGMRIQRREFITALVGAAAAWPITARAEQARKVARIGYLGLTTPSSHAKYSQAFRDGLRRLGYVGGTNVVIDFRFAEENTDRLPALAAELVRDNVDVIVTYATGVPVAQRTTATIPIVMATYGDAISTGVVAWNR
jgi:ABC-type uncharacterized transport system substrate-binding protein